MSAADRNGNNAVRVIRDGRVVTVPYRRAVGLISVGRAQWAPSAAPTPPPAVTAPVQEFTLAGEPTIAPDEVPELVELPTTGTVAAPVVVPEAHVNRAVSPAKGSGASVSTPAAVKAAEPAKGKSKPTVSVPTRKGAEDDLTGYEPSPPDQ